MPKSNKKRKNGTVKNGSAKKEGVTAPKMSPRTQVEAVAKGLQALAQDFQNLVPAIEQGFQQVNTNLNQQISQLSEVVGAVISVLDLKDKVGAKIKEDRAAADARQEQDKKAGLDALIEKGIYAAATEIKQDSIIVGIETDKEGVALPPGRRQLNLAGMKPEFAQQLIGKGLGAKLTPDGTKTLTVTEIFNLDAEKLAAVQKAEAEAAQKAQEEVAKKAAADAIEKAKAPEAQP